MGPIDLSPLFYLAIIGLIASVIAIIGGGGWLIWFVINHVRII